MSMRDLIYKIVPAKVVIRELKTGTGKTLTKESEYVLLEQKNFVSVGKKQKIEYNFELDIVEGPKKTPEEELEEKTPRNPLYLDLENFSLSKLKATIFLTDFPLNFFIRTLEIWQRLIPKEVNLTEWKNKDDVQYLNSAKNTIRDTRVHMLEYLKHLSNYLSECSEKRQVMVWHHFLQKADGWNTFKSTFETTPFTYLAKDIAQTLE